MCKTPKVTFIVPMYNVEKYIEKCIQSIRNQSISDIELILVNDGSPDQSGMIADNLSAQDSRIQVIHTGNSGVSSARNIGIDVAEGEYIVFVDGDDYLHRDYAKYMLSLAKESSADFAMSSNCVIYREGLEELPFEVTYEFEEWDNDRAIYELLYPGQINVGCWNKIFKREFIVTNNLNFSTELYMGEGLDFILRAAQIANKVAVGSEKVYYYRKDNENSATTAINVPKYINALRALDVINKHIVNKSDLYHEAMTAHLYIAKFYAFRAIQVTGKMNNYSRESCCYLRDLRKELPTLLKMNIKRNIKVRIIIFIVSPVLGDFISKLKK